MTFVTPVGMLGSVPTNQGVAKILCFLPDSARDFIAVLLSMATPFPPVQVCIGEGYHAFFGLPLIASDKLQAVVFTPSTTEGVTAIDSACNPLPLTLAPADGSLVRCSGSIRQSPKCTELLLRAIQVIKLQDAGYAKLFEPVAGGYVAGDRL
jgi:hypothetical protein